MYLLTRAARGDLDALQEWLKRLPEAIEDSDKFLDTLRHLMGMAILFGHYHVLRFLVDNCRRQASNIAFSGTCAMQ